MFVLVYSNRDVDFKRFKTKRYYLPKDIIKNYNAIINGKNFYNQAIGSDIKRHEQIKKLTRWRSYYWMFITLWLYKNHYRLIAVDLSRQKVLDADPKAIQQIELVGQLKNPDGAVAANESMFVLTILEKIKETRLKFSQGSVTVL